MINWKRVLRTCIQSAAGAGIAFVTTINNGFTKESLTQAGITFASTILLAVLMNIKNQSEEEAYEQQ